MGKTSVFLVDDHQLFREGLRLLLSNISFIGEIYEASNGQEFLDALGTVIPDIVFTGKDVNRNYKGITILSANNIIDLKNREVNKIL